MCLSLEAKLRIMNTDTWYGWSEHGNKVYKSIWQLKEVHNPGVLHEFIDSSCIFNNHGVHCIIYIWWYLCCFIWYLSHHGIAQNRNYCNYLCSNFLGWILWYWQTLKIKVKLYKRLKRCIQRGMITVALDFYCYWSI